MVKFAPLIVLPLWSGYPDARDNRSRKRFVAGAAIAGAASFFVLFLDGTPLHDAVVFFHESFGYQFGRSSPFSLWDWRQYHAKGIPYLHLVQRVAKVAFVAGRRSTLAAPPPRPCRSPRSPGALLIGFEVC